MAKALMRHDLTGKKFNMLTALYIDEEKTINGNVYWVCKCDCGNIKSVKASSLTRKRGIKSCGCLKHVPHVTNSKKIDMIGKRFGRLLVVEEKGYREIKNGDKIRKKNQWLCKCDCGKEIVTTGEQLRSGNTTSCGCYYKETRKMIGKQYNTYDLTTYEFGVGYCKNGSEFYFDKEDYDKIKNYCWNYDGRYVQAHSLQDDGYTTKIIRLHRVILNINDREDINVDHINLERNDCRKINLRRASDVQNGRNKIECFCTFENPVGILKVRENKYDVSIASKYRGSRSTLKEAIKYRQQLEKLIYGEFRFNPNANSIISTSKNILVS